MKNAGVKLKVDRQVRQIIDALQVLSPSSKHTRRSVRNSAEESDSNRLRKANPLKPQNAVPLQCIRLQRRTAASSWRQT